MKCRLEPGLPRPASPPRPNATATTRGSGWWRSTHLISPAGELHQIDPAGRSTTSNPVRGRRMRSIPSWTKKKGSGTPFFSLLSCWLDVGFRLRQQIPRPGRCSRRLNQALRRVVSIAGRCGQTFPAKKSRPRGPGFNRSSSSVTRRERVVVGSGFLVWPAAVLLATPRARADRTPSVERRWPGQDDERTGRGNRGGHGVAGQRRQFGEQRSEAIHWQSVFAPVVCFLTAAFECCAWATTLWRCASVASLSLSSNSIGARR
jgi:hypothetical protein